MKANTLIMAGATCLLLGASSLAGAAEQGWYLGLSGGETRSDLGGSDLDSTWSSQGFTASSSVDNTDNGWKLYAGYNYSKYFAVEGGWVDLGKVSFNSTVSAAPAGYSAGTLNGDVKTKGGVFLDAVGTLPLQNNFSVFGKLGLYDIETELNASGTSGTVNNSETRAGYKYGVGAGYDFARNFGARLEWERFNKVGDKNKTGEADIDLLSVGLTYKF